MSREQKRQWYSNNSSNEEEIDLHKAVQTSNVEMVKQGIKKNSPALWIRLIYEALKIGNFEICKLLLDKDSKICSHKGLLTEYIKYEKFNVDIFNLIIKKCNIKEEELLLLYLDSISHGNKQLIEIFEKIFPYEGMVTEEKDYISSPPPIINPITRFHIAPYNIRELEQQGIERHRHRLEKLGTTSTAVAIQPPPKVKTPHKRFSRKVYFMIIDKAIEVKNHDVIRKYGPSLLLPWVHEDDEDEVVEEDEEWIHIDVRGITVFIKWREIFQLFVHVIDNGDLETFKVMTESFKLFTDNIFFENIMDPEQSQGLLRTTVSSIINPRYKIHSLEFDYMLAIYIIDQNRISFFKYLLNNNYSTRYTYLIIHFVSKEENPTQKERKMLKKIINLYQETFKKSGTSLETTNNLLQIMYGLLIYRQQQINNEKRISIDTMNELKIMVKNLKEFLDLSELLVYPDMLRLHPDVVALANDDEEDPEFDKAIVDMVTTIDLLDFIIELNPRRYVKYIDLYKPHINHILDSYFESEHIEPYQQFPKYLALHGVDYDIIYPPLSNRVIENKYAREYYKRGRGRGYNMHLYGPEYNEDLPLPQDVRNIIHGYVAEDYATFHNDYKMIIDGLILSYNETGIPDVYFIGPISLTIVLVFLENIYVFENNTLYVYSSVTKTLSGNVREHKYIGMVFNLKENHPKTLADWIRKQTVPITRVNQVLEAYINVIEKRHIDAKIQLMHRFIEQLHIDVKTTDYGVRESLYAIVDYLTDLRHGNAIRLKWFGTPSLEEMPFLLKSTITNIIKNASSDIHMRQVRNLIEKRFGRDIYKRGKEDIKRFLLKQLDNPSVKKKAKLSDGFFAGYYMEALDTNNKWLLAEIINIVGEQVEITYIGFASKWDEWLSKDSERLAKLGTHIIGNYIDVQLRNNIWTVGKIKSRNNEEVVIDYIGWINAADEWISKKSNRLAKLGTHTNKNTSVKEETNDGKNKNTTQAKPLLKFIDDDFDESTGQTASSSSSSANLSVIEDEIINILSEDTELTVDSIILKLLENFTKESLELHRDAIVKFIKDQLLKSTSSVNEDEDAILRRIEEKFPLTEEEKQEIITCNSIQDHKEKRTYMAKTMKHHLDSLDSEGPQGKNRRVCALFIFIYKTNVIKGSSETVVNVLKQNLIKTSQSKTHDNSWVKPMQKLLHLEDDVEELDSSPRQGTATATQQQTPHSPNYVPHSPIYNPGHTSLSGSPRTSSYEPVSPEDNPEDDYNFDTPPHSRTPPVETEEDILESVHEYIREIVLLHNSQYGSRETFSIENAMTQITERFGVQLVSRFRTHIRAHIVRDVNIYLS